MSFKSYIIDRIPYILIYYLSNVFAVTVMQFDRIISKQQLSEENIMYVFIGSSFFMIIFLSIDYLRKKRVYSVLNSVAYEEKGLEGIFGTSGMGNREHSFFMKILSESYSRYENKLNLYRDRQKEQLHFMNQWVHQMKTPVSVINLILQNGKSSLGPEQLDSIAEEVDKLSHGLEMVLYNARISDFEMDFKIEKVDILSVVRSVINDHKKELIHYAIYPKLVGEEGIMVDTDAKWIRFVINQIITNSIKYSKDKPKDTKELLVSINKEPGFTRLSIRDEGIGIPAEDIPRVFSPFFTGSNGRDYPESTGMGMYLSKTVCNKLGHGLSIESERGEWTKVSIRFYPGRSMYNLYSMTKL